MEGRSMVVCIANFLLQKRVDKISRGGMARPGQGNAMDVLQLFGLFAVTAMLVCYALEDRSHWYILGFAIACALGSAYGFLQGAWPFGLVEAIWAVVALRRWNVRRR
jgi:hypothetical protein